MDTEQLRKRLGRSDRGNGYWTSGRVKIGVRSRNRPRGRKSSKLACFDCEIDRCEQLGCKHGGVEPRIQVALRGPQGFTLFAHVKSGVLQISIIGARKRDRFVERQYLSAASLCVCAK